MKKFKIAFWIIPLAFLVLIGFQNKEFFQKVQSLRIDLLFTAYKTPELQLWIFFLALFFFGILLTYLFSLPGKFKAGKSMKTLNGKVSSQRNELTALKNEVAAMRNPAPVEPSNKEPAPDGPAEVER